MLSRGHYLNLQTLRLLYEFNWGQYSELNQSGMSKDAKFMSPWGEAVSLSTFALEAGSYALFFILD